MTYPLKKALSSSLLFAASLLFAVTTLADSASSKNNLDYLQKNWAHATYQLEGTPRQEALSELAEYARQITQTEPAVPEILIWKGIVLSSLAGEKGGLGALGLVKEARTSLQSALEIDPDALQGSAHTSLGTLYHQVPGWPIAFGSDKKAKAHLKKALTINPDGIDSNYFMGQFLFDEGEFDAARAHLEQAMKAPARPGRALADSGRKGEIQALLMQIPAGG
ncbi:MAG: tetratricopeptide repeat protein [Pseudomonadaceae bacterium]|nr:tetratricopeptide repeat protein [Pseudomonadaceae bacterium]